MHWVDCEAESVLLIYVCHVSGTPRKVALFGSQNVDVSFEGTRLVCVEKGKPKRNSYVETDPCVEPRKCRFPLS